MDVRKVLSQAERQWTAKSPASEPEIALLKSSARTELPAEYLDLLRLGNGGEGTLKLPPLWFVLYSIEECIAWCHTDKFVLTQFPEFMFFGSNGGMESIAFDLRVEPPWPIVMIDQIAGRASAKVIASNIETFIEAIGLDPDEQE